MITARTSSAAASDSAVPMSVISSALRAFTGGRLSVIVATAVRNGVVDEIHDVPSSTRVGGRLQRVDDALGRRPRIDLAGHDTIEHDIAGVVDGGPPPQPGSHRRLDLA